LVTTRSIEELTAPSYPPVEPFEPQIQISPSKAAYCETAEGNPRLSSIVKDSKHLNRECSVVLDSEATTFKSCFVICDNIPLTAETIVRSEFASVLWLLDSMQSNKRAARNFHNDAAITGSVFRYQLLQQIQQSTAPIKPSEYRQHTRWNTNCLLYLPKRPWYAAFRTVDVSVEVSKTITIIKTSKSKKGKKALF
jgi:hypothetical protein